MKLLSRLLAVGALLTAVQTFAADAFEGKVTLVMTGSKGTAQTVNCTIKGHVQRMDMTARGQDASVILDADKHQMTMLMHERHMFMVMPLQVPAQVVAKASESQSTAEFEKTGKTETILGYTCHQLLVKDAKGTTTEIWLAEGLGTFMGLGSGGNPFGGGASAPSKWEQSLKGVSGFPLRVISHDASSKETFKMEVTKIEPGPQPDSAFAPPADYQNPMASMPPGMSPFGH